MTDDSAKPDLSKLRIRRDDDTRRTGGKGHGYLWWMVGGVAVIGIALIVYLRPLGAGSAITVQTGSVERISPAASQSLLTATGYVVAQRKAAVASKGTGRLEVLNVEEGDRVLAGDVIGRLESADVVAALDAARAGIGQSEANLKESQAVLHEAQLNYDRVAGLLHSDLAAQSAFDNAEARLHTAAANVAAAAAALKRARADSRWAQVQVENTYIRAPFDGTVLTKNADVGEVVAPFAASASSRGALVTLADMTSLEVEADVSESNIRKITIDQPCLITLDALPAEPYSGRVKKIVPTADRAKATVMTKIVFDALDDRVLPEMSAKVNFLPLPDSGSHMMSTGTVLTVPNAAVVMRDGRDFVFRVRRETAEAVAVTRGQLLGGRIEITGDLSAGDPVVLMPPDNLQDGDHITQGE